MSNLSPDYREFASSTAIAHLVSAFWYFSTPDPTAQANDLIQHRVLPDGCMDIIFQYERSIGGIDNPQLTLYGSTDCFNLFEIKPSTEFVGVRFHPGMAGRFFKRHPIELFQQKAKAQDCSEEFGWLFERLCDCQSPEQAFRILQTSLLELQRHCGDGIPLAIREALRLILTSQGRMPVSQIAEVIGISERTVRRGVTAAAGLSPKVLSRILRFQNVVSRLRSPESADLCGIAQACGYADQAHMGREFHRLAGLTPTAFIS